MIIKTKTQSTRIQWNPDPARVEVQRHCVFMDQATALSGLFSLCQSVVYQTKITLVVQKNFACKQGYNKFVILNLC